MRKYNTSGRAEKVKKQWENIMCRDYDRKIEREESAVWKLIILSRPVAMRHTGDK